MILLAVAVKEIFCSLTTLFFDIKHGNIYTCACKWNKRKQISRKDMPKMSFWKDERNSIWHHIHLRQMKAVLHVFSIHYKALCFCRNLPTRAHTHTHTREKGFNFDSAAICKYHAFELKYYKKALFLLFQILFVVSHAIALQLETIMVLHLKKGFFLLSLYHSISSKLYVVPITLQL